MSLDRTAATVLLARAQLFPNEPAGLSFNVASTLLDVAQAIDHHGTGGAAADSEHADVARRAAQSGVILVEDRSFVQRAS